MTESAAESTETRKLNLTATISTKSSVNPELKSRKIAALERRNAEIEAEIVATKVKLEEVSRDLRYPAKETVRSHIAHLHAYNEIRDVGQGLMGLVADGRNVRIAEVYEEFGVNARD